MLGISYALRAQALSKHGVAEILAMLAERTNQKNDSSGKGIELTAIYFASPEGLFYRSSLAQASGQDTALLSEPG